MFEQAAKLIEERLASNWSTTPIDYDNVAYAPIRGTSFVSLHIEWFAADQPSIGGRVKGQGYVELSIYTPAGQGSRKAAVIADSLAAIFNRYYTDTLKFKVGVMEGGTQQEEWYQLKLIIPFTYDFCIP